MARVLYIALGSIAVLVVLLVGAAVVFSGVGSGEGGADEIGPPTATDEP